MVRMAGRDVRHKNDMSDQSCTQQNGRFQPDGDGGHQ
jgi:hypothetical protein